ncbi:MAG: hypothetical protein ACRCXE_03945, partial [Metamycoplasmataceae bacterium]
VPLAVVASCGTSDSDVNYEISAKNDPKLVRADIVGEQFKTLSTLTKVFDGITSENMNNITAKMDAVDSPDSYEITITAKTGYTINDEKSLKSKVFTVDDNLTISKITTPPTDIKPSDIEEDNFKNFLVLSKLFNGEDFTQPNLANLVIEKIDGTEKDTYQIQLSPITGVTINGSSEPIISEIFTLLVDNLTISQLTEMPTNITIENLEDAAFIASKDFLDRLFNLGTLTQTQLDNKLNVSYENVSGKLNKIVLTAKTIDIRINDEETLESNQFMIVENLTISRIDSALDIGADEINDQNKSSLATLKNMFVLDDSITQDIIDDALTVTVNDFTEPVMKSVTLTVNPGYILNGDESINSIESNRFVPQTTIRGVALRENPILTMYLEDITTNLHTRRTLDNFFTVNDAQVTGNNFTSHLNGDPNSGNTLTITLRAIEGRIFPGGREITSVSFVLPEILGDVTAKPAGIDNVTNADVEGENLQSLNTLEKIFDGLDADIVTHITATIASAGTGN